MSAFKEITGDAAEAFLERAFEDGTWDAVS